MTLGELEKILDHCSSQILRYEDGDLMALSGIIDDLEEARKQSAGFPEFSRLVEKLQALLKSVFKGGEFGVVAEAVTLGFDVISRLVHQLVLAHRDMNALAGAVSGPDLRDDIARFTAAADLIIAPEKQAAGNAGTRPAADEEAGMSLSGEPFKIFLAEASGKVIRAQDVILELEKQPEHREYLNELFRIFHTIKGECGFLKIGLLGELAHNLENLLALLREKPLPIDSVLVDILLDGIDLARHILEILGKGDLALFRRINLTEYVNRINSFIGRTKSNLGDILLEQGKLTDEEVREILLKQKELSYAKKFGEIAVAEHFISGEELAESLRSQSSPEAGSAADSIIKVKASQVNFLVDMIGELIIAEAQFDEKVGQLTHLRKITREIQSAAMQLRTEKVQTLFITMKRVARDAAKQLGKRVTTSLQGADLEIDRDVVEKLEEPLVHLVRNAVGHGIEGEAERVAAGKAAEGNILLEARRRGNTIVIAVQDDGRGLDRAKILAKAVEKGLITVVEANRLSDAEVYDFIFNQGFSTAANVDLVSGRGVGMDIVKSVTEAARGRVQIKTVAGAFTRTELVFPLHTAIIDGMIVKSAGTCFVIPVANVIESLAVDGKKLFSVRDRSEVIDVRGEIIPMIRLAVFFGQRREGPAAGGARTLAVIVENSQQKKAALLLDEIVTKREVFIKALGVKFRNLKGISSGTILQGGRIGFVLDVDEIVQEAAARAPVMSAPAG